MNNNSAPKEQFERCNLTHGSLFSGIGNRLMIEKGKYQEFECADDVIEWWVSGISRKKYMGNKKQLKINFDSAPIKSNYETI